MVKVEGPVKDEIHPQVINSIPNEISEVAIEGSRLMIMTSHGRVTKLVHSG
jgi:hypothetical protein